MGAANTFFLETFTNKGKLREKTKVCKEDGKVIE